MRQAKVNVWLHLVWATWDRLPLLTDRLHRRVHDAMAAKCVELGVQLLAYGGVEDHVHVIVRFPATSTIAVLVGQLKGASSHLLTHEVEPLKFFKWQGGYGAFSLSARHLKTSIDYVHRQREHHAERTTIAAYEPDAIDKGSDTAEG
jgi:REP element-mobilizing transposase RayT